MTALGQPADALVTVDHVHFQPKSAGEQRFEGLAGCPSRKHVGNCALSKTIDPAFRWRMIIRRAPLAVIN